MVPVVSGRSTFHCIWFANLGGILRLSETCLKIFLHTTCQINNFSLLRVRHILGTFNWFSSRSLQDMESLTNSIKDNYVLLKYAENRISWYWCNCLTSKTDLFEFFYSIYIKMALLFNIDGMIFCNVVSSNPDFSHILHV